MLSVMNELIIKFQSKEGKIKLLKTFREKNKITFIITEFRFALKLSTVVSEARRQWRNAFKTQRKRLF